jgi:hypothetical protein
MFENFRAEDAIECVVGKVELRHVAGHGDNARIMKRRLLQVERSHRNEMLLKYFGKKPVSCPDIEYCGPALGQNAQ